MTTLFGEAGWGGIAETRGCIYFCMFVLIVGFALAGAALRSPAFVGFSTGLAVAIGATFELSSTGYQVWAITLLAPLGAAVYLGVNHQPDPEWLNETDVPPVPSHPDAEPGAARSKSTNPSVIVHSPDGPRVNEAPETRLPLSIDGLVVRRVVPSDFDHLLAYWSDPAVALYQFRGPHTADQVRAMIDEQAEVRAGDPGVALVLVAVLDGVVIGDCQLTVTSGEDRQGEVGFAFNPRYTGRGLATRAVAAVLGFGFIQLGLHRIVAAMDDRNERSWRLAERVGMRREAHFRHDNLVGERWMDSFVYAMLDEEWRARHPDLVPSMAGA
jgi:aminoglycoside 6'-N-acetyltransferase